MKQGIVTQRLIGAVVLVSLAVIFVPMILTGEGELVYNTGRNAVPPEPEYEFAISAGTDVSALREEVREHTAVKVVEPDLDLAAKEVASTTIKRDQDPPAAASGNPAEDKKRLQRNRAQISPSPRTRQVQAWAVQVASFTEQQRALSLRDKLRKNNYVASVESVQLGTGLSYRVRIGPMVTRDDAEKTKKKIKESLNLNGFVVRQ